VGILFLDFQFSTAHQFFCFRSVLKRKSSSRRRRCGNVGISPSLRDFQGGVEMVGSAPFAFHHFHPPAFPQRSVYFLR
jgi:hypothetical protein